MVADSHTVSPRAKGKQPKRLRVQYVSSPSAWQVFISPVRTEVMDALRLQGPCSIADLARALDRPADTLYRHVHLLREAGFVRDMGYRKGGRNNELLIDVTASDYLLDFRDSNDEVQNLAIVDTVNSFTGAIQRATRDSARARQLVFDDDGRNLTISYEVSWLTPGRFRQVRALVARLRRLMKSGHGSREGRLYMSLAVAVPVTRKRGVPESKPRRTTTDSRVARIARASRSATSRQRSRVRAL